MVTYASQRGTKPEEAIHRALETNLIGTLVAAGAGPGVFMHGVNENQAFTLSQALTSHYGNGDRPLLWAYINDAQGEQVKFGYDREVTSAANPAAQAKIGHVALTNAATISGEIIPVAGGWDIDNNSGAWGSMANNNGKTTALAAVAQLIHAQDPGGIVVNARRAYSRKGWKRKIQQIFR